MLRLDGNHNTAITEKLGPLAPLAGQSIIVVNTAGAAVKFEFASASAAQNGGQVAFAGTVAFTANPVSVGSILPWGLAPSNYIAAPTAAVNTVVPDSLAVTTANGVQPLTTYLDNDLTQAAANVRLTAHNTNNFAVSVNSLTIDGGSLVLNQLLTITSGAVMNRSATASIDGIAALNATGRLYLNAAQPLTVNAPIQTAHLSKGANSSVTINGRLDLGPSPLVAVNAGTLAFGPLATVNAFSGTVTYQVSKEATLANIPHAIDGDLRGNGTVSGPVSIANGGRITASALAGGLPNGDCPGVLTLTGPLTLAGGAIVRINISSKFGGEYTQSSLNGTTLDLSGISPTKPVILEIQSLALSNDGLAPIYDADAGEIVELTLGTFSGGITGFAADKFAFTTIGNSGANFAIVHSENRLVVTFTAIPEPALGLILVGLIGVRRRISD